MSFCPDCGKEHTPSEFKIIRCKRCVAKKKLYDRIYGRDGGV